MEKETSSQQSAQEIRLLARIGWKAATLLVPNMYFPMLILMLLVTAVVILLVILLITLMGMLVVIFPCYALCDGHDRSHCYLIAMALACSLLCRRFRAVLPSLLCYMLCLIILVVILDVIVPLDLGSMQCYFLYFM